MMPARFGEPPVEPDKKPMSTSTKTPKEKRFRSLTATLSLSFFVLIAVAILITGLLGLYFDYQSQKRAVANELNATAQSAGEPVKDFLNTRFQELSSAADISKIISAGKKEDQEIILDRLLGDDSSFRELFLLDEEGNTLTQSSRVSSISQDTISKDQLETAILPKILARERYVGPVYLGKDTSEPLILIAIPARDMFGDIKGVLVAEVNLKFMWNSVTSLKVGENGLAYVVDEYGHLIAFKDTGRVLAHEDMNGLAEVKMFKQGQVNPGLDIARGINGTYVATSYADLTSPHWGVVVEIPLFEAYKEIVRLFGLSSLTFILALILAELLGISLARRITEPLVHFRDVVNKIGAGNFNVQVSVESNDEISQVAGSFNKMLTELRTLYQNLEEKVKERTEKLDVQVKETEKTKLAILNLLEDVDNEKKRAEEMVIVRTKELSEEKARLLASINSLSLGFIIADVDDVILLKNPAISRILGITEDFKTLKEVAKCFDNFNLLGSCRECIDLKQVVEIKEVPYGKKTLRIFCAPVSNNDVTIGYVFLAEDITEAKVLERSREEFFAVASHELRTPLTAIRGNADMILEMYGDKIKDPDVKEMLHDIDASSVRLIEIVNDFLEVSRLEQGRIEIKKETFDVSEIAQKVLNTLKTEASKKNITLSYDGEKIPQVTADKNRVEQVLMNLVGNALKFTKNGGSVKVHVETLDRFAKIQTKDSGVGILPQNQTLLFRKFQQAGEKVLARDITQGTGLGLYISKLLVSGMGGSIGLEESTAKGSTFTFTLPLAS